MDWKSCDTEALHACFCEMANLGIATLPNVALQPLFEDLRNIIEELMPVFMEQLALRTGAQERTAVAGGQTGKTFVVCLDRSDSQHMQALLRKLLPLRSRCTD